MNLAKLVAGVDSPLPSAAPRVQDAWIHVGIKSTSTMQRVEPTTTMSSPSFNPAIGTAYDQILSSHVENMQANCSINARGSFPKTDIGERQNTGLGAICPDAIIKFAM